MSNPRYFYISRLKNLLKQKKENLKLVSDNEKAFEERTLTMGILIGQFDKVEASEFLQRRRARKEEMLAKDLSYIAELEEKIKAAQEMSDEDYLQMVLSR